MSRSLQPLRAMALSFALSCALSFAHLALTVLLTLTHAPASAQAQERSGYASFKGEPFFLLSDAAYGSEDVAQVRLEVPGRDMGAAKLQEYGGADIVVYRIPQPLEFLKKQPNLHRIQVEGNYRGEGLSNTLAYLWDRWWKQSRYLWRKLFSSEARVAVTHTQAGLATDGRAITRPTEFRHQPQYQPLKGFALVDRFRYPIWKAEPIAPPKDVKLDGSSSEFIQTHAGNVMIPIGKRKPGLYLVEAIIGEHRATTLVFVADTMGVTKVSSQQMLVWAARRDNGAAVAGVNVAWTDGTGVLQSGSTGADGVASFERGSPEHTYVMGEDRAGGVFVSENFYYDSEIYNTKIYAVTDRPLYRPGDEVNVKVLAREFVSARVSRAAAAAPLDLVVLDPNGTPLLTQALQLNAESGAETRFRLPDGATAGGYELRLSYQGDQYGAAFRVAEYVKPHFEINVVPNKAEFKTGEAVKGKIELRYPDGKPVSGARVSLTLRSQKNTMVEGELRYTGLFPVELKKVELSTGGDGEASFDLPPATDPSRYILTVLATDGAAYRVKATRELMIERSASVYRLKAPRQFSAPGETVQFQISAQDQGGSGASVAARPARWELVQLEKQTTTSGDVDPARSVLPVTFADSGSYQLSLRDAGGHLLGATSHWVSGAGVKAVPGSIEIVMDKERYAPGESADVLITFAEPVEQALLTLERDKVEQVGLLSKGASWIDARRVAPKQWRARIPVKADYGPNVTFSVAYTRRGDFVFQNAGLQVIEPRIEMQFKTDKEVYRPGETVTLDVLAQLDGKPVATQVTLGVVDEMIYVLQPEIAPDIADFFYHPRRNNVRTTASLSFISYDMAAGRSSGVPARHNYNERGVKVLERPRRDNIDTALWAPSLRTGADGHVRVSFVMPDSLTRWRITGRAFDAEGRVGQRSGYVRSDKNFYAKWTSPDWMRVGDAPQASVAVFNQTDAAQELNVTLLGGATPLSVKLQAKRGINYVQFPVAATSAPLRLEVRQGAALVDTLDTIVKAQPVAWDSPRTLMLPLNAATAALTLPSDARDLRVSFVQGAGAHFARIADDLISYPYGCVEQTASRLIPLALGVTNLGAQTGREHERLQNTLQSQRLRLVQMAGPNAVFGWWGDATGGSALMTAYAYYADWYAARALRIALPPEHFNNLLTVYTGPGLKEPLLHRALVLWMAQELGLPVKTLVSGLADDVAAAAIPNDKAAARLPASSVILGNVNARDTNNLTLALVAQLARQNGLALAEKSSDAVAAAVKQLRDHPSSFAQALLMLRGEVPAAQADAVLAKVSADMPTLDRALTLVWVQKALGGTPSPGAPVVTLDAPWQKGVSNLGQAIWRWTDGKTLPAALQLAQAAPAGTLAVVQYVSRAAESHTLPVVLERRIMRMEASDANFRTAPMKAGDAFSTDGLYIDEITLRAAPGSTHRYGLLEVPLPPGASVESGTWGITMAGDKPAPLEAARHEARRDGYVVPVDPLTGEIKIRHLLRFAQKGAYVLPPARFYRMYQPEQKALEGGGKVNRTVRVE